MSEPDEIPADVPADPSLSWENEVFLDSIVDNIPLMVFVKEAESLRFVRLNKAGEKLVGLTNAELLGKNDFDFFPKEQAAFFTAKDMEVLRGGTLTDIPEEPINTPDGVRILHTRKIPILDAEGKARYLLGISEDITERKKAEETNARLVAIMEAASDLIGIAGVDGRFHYLNAAGRRMLGLGIDDDLSSRHFREFYPAWAIRSIEEEAIPAALRDGAWSGETALITSSKIEFPVSQVITAHRDHQSNVRYLSTIVRDISEMKKINAELVQTKKMEAAATLAAGTAHEFNNLHTAILMAAEFIKDQAGDNKEIHACVSEILAATERASGLTRRLLAFARLDRLSRPMTVNLNELVRKESASLQVVLGRNVELAFELDPLLDNVSIDPADFSQVLFCLAENARDAMPSGGKVLIGTSHTTLTPEASLNDVAAGNYVQLSFADTGSGMDLGTKSRLFEPFFTTKGRASGTGLGLAALYGIVKRQGGTVIVKSEPGHGARFDVLLPPVCPIESSPRGAGATPMDFPSAFEKDRNVILLVDDEPALRRLMRTQLEQHGFVVRDTGTPDEALKIVQSAPRSIALLVTDLLMPQMDGRELAGRVLEMSPDVRVLYISGYSTGGPTDALTGARQPFLAKPCTGESLVEKVRQVLSSATIH